VKDNVIDLGRVRMRIDGLLGRDNGPYADHDDYNPAA
jgi:hypothetical protein